MHEIQRVAIDPSSGTWSGLGGFMLMLCYHELSAGEANPWILAPVAFREHLAILAERDYRTVSLDASDGDGFWDDRTVVLSFDDGRDGCLRHALECLGKFHVPAIFYICPGLIGGTNVPEKETYSRFLNWDDVRTLAASGHLIGSHACTHRSFEYLPPAERRSELTESRRILEDQVGRECRHFAPPYGYLDRPLSHLAIETGYRTTASTVFGINREPSSKSCLRRWEIRSPCGGSTFEEGLKELERRGKEYRVLQLPSAARVEANGRWSLNRLAEYDLILYPSGYAGKIPGHYPIRCLENREINRRRSAAFQEEPDRNRLAEAVRQLENVPANVEIRIDFE